MGSSSRLVLLNLLSVLITASQLYSGVLSQGSIINIEVPGPAVGPHSVAFDFFGRGPYTCISDGRILRYSQARRGFFDFAYTSPNRLLGMIFLTGKHFHLITFTSIVVMFYLLHTSKVGVQYRQQ